MIRSNDWCGLALANGRYLITSKLGEGGMGSVYRALDRNIDADVVIKVPRQSMLEDPGFADRFTREIRSLVKLSHPGIVKVSDVGEWDDVPFAVMQFLPGGSLEDRLPARPDGRRAGVSDPKALAGWLAGIADALDYVHSQGYVHRDVKPGNILFDAQGHAFLGDFGVAKVLSSAADAGAAQAAMTGTGMVLGTPEYMAPELIMGDPFDGRADQYALAVTVYEALCGRRPFEDEVKTRVLVLHTTKAVPAVNEFRPAIPGALSQAVLKGLAKDPGLRYPSCAALAAAVVAEAEAGLLRQDDRVRIRCETCNRGFSLSLADFSKRKQASPSIGCPVCKAPILLSTADVDGKGASLPGAGTGRVSTVVLSFPEQSGEYGLKADPAAGHAASPTPSAPRGQGATVPEGLRAPSPRGEPGKGTPTPEGRPKHPPATMIERSPGHPPATMIERSPGHPPATMIERSPGRPASPTMVEGLAGLGKPAPEAPRAPRERRDPARTGAPSSRWLALGAGALLPPLVLALVVWGLMPSRETKPTTTSGRLAPSPPANTVAPRPTPVPTPVLATRPAEPPSRPADPAPARPTTTLASVEAPGVGPGMLPRPSEDPGAAGLAPVKEPTSGGEDVNPSRPAADDEGGPMPAGPSREDWSPEVLARKPVKAKLPLSKILGSPGSFHNQVLVPTGMYCLASPPSVETDGSRRLSVIESRIVLQRDGSPAVRSVESSELEIEPRLADHLDRLLRGSVEPQNNKVAILTVWVTSRGTGRLIKVEQLTSFRHRIVNGGMRYVSDMEYLTLTIAPQGSTTGLAPDEEWEKPERMLPLANRYKRAFKAMKNQSDAVARANLDSAMNRMFGQMMRGAVAQEAADANLRMRMLRGR